MSRYRSRPIRLLAVPAVAALFGVAALTAPPGQARAAAGGVAPPAEPLSNYEVSTGHALTRDCGYSTPVSGPANAGAQDLWLFCDTIDYATDAADAPIDSAVLGTDTAAEAPLVPGQVPQDLTEVTTPSSVLTLPSDRGPQPFLPVPSGLTLPGGTSACAGSTPPSPNGVYGAQSPGIYPASWFTGVTRDPLLRGAPDQVLMAFNDYCVDGETGDINTLFTDEGFGLVAYDPHTNRIGKPVSVFTSADGQNLPVAEQLTSPVSYGGYLYLFGFTCASSAFGACSSGDVFMARVPATANAWQNPGQYRFWTGSGWSSAAADAGNLIPGVTPLGISVGDYSATGHGLVLVDESDLGGGFQVWTAKSPVGPWTLLRTGTVPSSCSGGEFGCYALNGHAELSTAGSLMISYYDPAGLGHLHLAAFPWQATAAAPAAPSAKAGVPARRAAGGQAGVGAVRRAP